MGTMSSISTSPMNLGVGCKSTASSGNSGIRYITPSRKIYLDCDRQEKRAGVYQPQQWPSREPEETKVLTLFQPL